MFKIIADKLDRDGNIAESRTETVDSFATILGHSGKTADIELTMPNELHIVLHVGAKSTDYQYVRVFKHDGDVPPPLSSDSV